MSGTQNAGLAAAAPLGRLLSYGERHVPEGSPVPALIPSRRG